MERSTHNVYVLSILLSPLTIQQVVSAVFHQVSKSYSHPFIS